MARAVTLEPPPLRRATEPPPVPSATEQQTVTEALARTPLFATLAPEHIARLARTAQRRRYDAGQIVMVQGEPGDTLAVILSGELHISVASRDGHEATLAVLVPGDVCGELALLDGGPRSATVTAIQPTVVLSLRRDDFLAILHQAPPIAVRLLEVLARRLRSTDHLVEDALFLDVAGRLAKKLLALAAAVGRRTLDGIELELPVTQQALAGLIGATRESVNKQLGHMRARRIIALDRRRLTILRPEALESYVRPR